MIRRPAAALRTGVSALVVVAVLVGGVRGAEVVPQVNQGSGATSLTNYITNNDNTIYNTATFDLVGTYGNILQAIKDRNPAYAGMTVNEIGGLVGLTVQNDPIGEVNNGWVASYSVATGKVTLSNNGGSKPSSYDRWNSSDSNNDMMALTFNFGNLLDINGNGVTDGDERLVAAGSLWPGFRGIEGGFQYGGATPMYEFEWVKEALGETRLEGKVEGGELVLNLEGLLGGRSYVLESNEDLEDGMGWEEAASWEMPGVSLPGVRLSEEWREPLVPGGRRFYRLRWEVP